MFASLSVFLGTVGECFIIIALTYWTIHSFIKVVGGPNGAKGFDNYIFNFLTSALGIFAKFVLSAEAQLAGIASAVVTAFGSSGPTIQSQFRTPIANFVRTELDLIRTQLTGAGLSIPGNAETTAANAMAEAFSFGAASAAASAVFEAALPEKLNTLNGVGPMLAKMAGFDEVAAAVRDPLYENAFGKSLDYYYKNIFKPDYPDEGDAVTWHARGLLTDAQLEEIFKYSGLKQVYEPAYVASAYRPVSAFIMLRLLESGVIDNATLQSALQFNGYRAQDIQALITYAQWAALTSYRAQYLSAVINAAERGVMTDAEVDSALTSMQAPAGANNFVHLTIATRKLEQLAEIYRKSVSEAYKYGLITDADYVPNLEAIGIAAADAQAHYAVDSIAKQGKGLAAEQRLAAQQARKLEAAAVRAAVAEYRTGTIDAAALLAALLAAGMDAGIAGFAVAYNQARLAGTQVIVHGALVARSAASALRDQVDAIVNQVKYAGLSAAAAQQQLEALGIPSANAQALAAGAAAYGAATVLPVT